MDLCHLLNSDVGGIILRLLNVEDWLSLMRVNSLLYKLVGTGAAWRGDRSWYRYPQGEATVLELMKARKRLKRLISPAAYMTFLEAQMLRKLAEERHVSYFYVCGPSGVGRYSLCKQLVCNHFVDEQYRDDSWRKHVVIDEEASLMDIVTEVHSGWRDEGEVFLQEELQRHPSNYCVMVVYCITNRNSFDECVHYLDTVRRLVGTHDIAVVLCGNKCDLKEQRQVSSAEGRQLADSYRIRFFEVSAKSRVNVDVAFFEGVRVCRENHDRHHPPIVQPRPKCECF